MKAVKSGEAVQLIRASALIPSPYNPRKRVNEKADQELRDSIEARGILSPIIARPAGDDAYEIGAGHRRWRIAQSIEGEEAQLPVIVRDLDDAQFRDLVMLENLQRDDLHPLDEAEGYQQLMTDKGIDLEELAGLVNKKPAEVVGSLQLLKLSDKSKGLFDAGKFDAAYARQLARLQEGDQAEALKESKREGGYSVHALREFVNRRVALELGKAPFDTESADLLPLAGACTVCPKRSGANTLLFADVKAKDICFDRKCFNMKCDVYIAGIEGQLERDGKKFVRVSYEYRARKAGVIGTEKYRKLTRDMKDCEKTTLGVVHEKGWNEGRLGDILRICVDEKCRIHRDQYGREKSAPKSAAEQRKTRIQNLTTKRDLTIRQETLNAVCADIRKKGAGVEDLKLAVESYFSRYWHDAKREYFKRKGIEPIKHAGYGGKDFEATFKKHVLPGAKTVEDLQALLVDLALHFEVDGHNKKTEALDEAAKRRGVDVALIRRAITKEFEPKLSKLKQGPKKDQKKPKEQPAKKKARKKPKPAKTPR